MIICISIVLYARNIIKKQKPLQEIIKLFGGVKYLLRRLIMIKVRIAQTFEVDNNKLEKFCYKNQIKIVDGKNYLKEKMIKACQNTIKEIINNGL
tara:strand:- start:4 stop:288 length:285 start_codon:yes stop_codon:yes gene_type:complete